jgi:RNA polymerase sigma-70 factor (ECF subfamily)
MQQERKPGLALATEPAAIPQCSGAGGGLQRSEEELVLAAQSGDLFALNELLGRHQRMLYSFAYRFAANADEAADLVQETMLRAFRNIGRFRGESKFGTWLAAIAMNEAFDMKREQKRVHWAYLDEPHGTGGNAWKTNLQDLRPNPEESYLRQELRGLMRREVVKLRPKYRLVLQACDFDECPVEQVARSWGMKLGTAKTRLRRARQSLGDALRRHGTVPRQFHASSR